MAEYNSENHALNLPDSYKKTEDSNNHKILEIERCEVNKIREALQQVDDALDLDNATGKTLDHYGETVGQPRGQANDAQYVTMIKARIARNLTNGSYPSIIKALCATFGCEPTQVFIEEDEQPCTVKSTALPLDAINRAELTVSQTIEIIKRMLPVGVTLSTFLTEGTFEFAETAENEYDENAGFSDVEGGTIGGYFGDLYSEDDETILPI